MIALIVQMELSFYWGNETQNLACLGVGVGVAVYISCVWCVNRVGGRDRRI